MALAQNVRDLLSNKLGVPITTRDSSLGPNQITVTAKTFMKQDAARVGFLLLNLGSVALFARPQGGLGGPPSGLGVKIEGLGGNAFAWWEEDGELVAREWEAFTTSGATTQALVEYLIDQGRKL